MKMLSADMSDADFEAEIAKWTTLLSSNQRKQWRGIFCKGHANALVVACRAAGATHAIFIANGNTAAAQGAVSTGGTAYEPASDLGRSLTNRGSAQCMVARDEWYGRLPMRSTLFSSPALRAKQTVRRPGPRAAACVHVDACSARGRL